jgi:ATP-dependent Lon protease
VDRYTREAGVRELERVIGRACRKVAARVAALPEGETPEQVVLTPDNLEEYLGPRRYFTELVERCKQPGVVVGLAWTPVGGEILFIEATSMPGKGGLQLTGKLGGVMSESARIALSLVRSRAERFQIPDDLFSRRELHLHVPSGAVPKDGPSAGVAMTCALLSLLWRGKGRAARARVAMTGEITLRGAVLPVGGIREKVIGAKRAGIKKVVLPRQNEPDVEEIEPAVRRGLKFVFVGTLEEAVEAVIGPLPR